MKALRLGSKGEQVRIMQAIIGELEVDGSYGPATEKRVIQYQKEHGLLVDGKFGPQCWNYVGFVQPYNSNLYVWKLDLDTIKDVGVYLKNYRTDYNVARFAKEYGLDIAINAGFFNMKDTIKDGKVLGRNRQNLTDMVIDGKPCETGIGNFSSNGLYMKGNGMMPAATKTVLKYPSTYTGDYIGGSPTLIYRGEVVDKGTSAKTQRMALGYFDGELWIITTGQANKASTKQLISEAKYQGINTLLNLDGGGSVAMDINGHTVFTAGRNIPSAVGIKR